MIRDGQLHEYGSVHFTDFLIDIPDYLSFDLLSEIIKELEVWIDEERKPYMSRKVFFPTVFLELKRTHRDDQSILTLYHKVVKRRTYRKIPQIVEELKNRIIAKKPLFHIDENFRDLFIKKLNER